MTSPADPRAARSREAILAAARRILLHEGPAAITHQRVALEAGVGRATVYRHWSRAEQLLLDVMAGADMPFFRNPERPVRQWLRRELRTLADQLALPEVAAVALTLMQGAVWDPQILAQRDHFIRVIDERLAAALALAVAHQEFEPFVDPEDASAMLIGPILHRTALQAGTATGGLINRLIDSIGNWPGPAPPE